uniref:Uncharacterized protein n=1 Tax=Oryza punctata TaxID=4537 RepID=A0A0E0MK27_ORYPU
MVPQSVSHFRYPPWNPHRNRTGQHSHRQAEGDRGRRGSRRLRPRSPPLSFFGRQRASPAPPLARMWTTPSLAAAASSPSSAADARPRPPPPPRIEATPSSARIEGGSLPSRCCLLFFFVRRRVFMAASARIWVAPSPSIAHVVGGVFPAVAYSGILASEPHPSLRGG